MPHCQFIKKETIIKEMATEMDLVGLTMTVTLTNGIELAGTVFTYVKERSLLVLAINPSSDSPNFKMVNTNFIKSFTVESDTKAIPKDQRLPHALDAYATLPPAPKSAKDFTLAKKKLVAEEKKRQDRLELIVGEDKVPVAAVDLFLEISRIYPNTAWNSDESTITVDDIVIVGEPDWGRPCVKIVSGCEVTAGAKERIETLVRKIMDN